MASSNVQILARMGVASAANHNAIIDDFSSEGLAGLQNVTDEEVRDACASYAKRQDGAFLIVLMPIQRKRMKAFVLLVNYHDRVAQPSFA